MIRRAIVIAIVIVGVVVIANDAWRYVEAQQRLRDTTYSIARWAAENAPSQSRNEVAREISATLRLASQSRCMVRQTRACKSGLSPTCEHHPGQPARGPHSNKSFQDAASPHRSKDYREAGIR
jgi:hypothetical protein